jgi:hypothetical protein
MCPITSDKEKPTRLNLNLAPAKMERDLVLSDSPLEGILPGREYLIIKVPFCKECAERLFRWFKLSHWLLGAALIVSLVLSIWLGLKTWQGFLLTVILAIPGAWLMRDKDWVVRVVDYNNNTMTLEIKRPEFAREVAQLNKVAGNSLTLIKGIGFII